MSEKKTRRLKTDSAVKEDLDIKSKTSNQEEPESRSSSRLKKRRKELFDEELVASSDYSLSSFQSPYIPYKNVIYSQTTISQYESENHNHSLEALCSEGCPVYQIKNLGNAVTETLNSKECDSTIQRKLVVSDGLFGHGTPISHISSNDHVVSGSFESGYQSKSNQLSLESRYQSKSNQSSLESGYQSKSNQLTLESGYKSKSNQIMPESGYKSTLNQISLVSRESTKLSEDYYLSHFQSRDREATILDTLTDLDKAHTHNNNVGYCDALNSNIYSENFAYDAISDDEDNVQNYRESTYTGVSNRKLHYLHLFYKHIYSFVTIIMPPEHKMTKSCCPSSKLLFIVLFLLPLILFYLGFHYLCGTSQLLPTEVDSQGSLFPFSLWSVLLFNITHYSPVRLLTYLESSPEPEASPKIVTVKHISEGKEDIKPVLEMSEVHKYIKELVKLECGNQDLHPSVKSLIGTVSGWGHELDQLKSQLGQQTSQDPAIDARLLHLQTKSSEMEAVISGLEAKLTALLSEVQGLHMKCEVPKDRPDLGRLAADHQASLDSLKSEISLLKSDLLTWQHQANDLASSCVDRKTAEYLVDSYLTKYFSALVGDYDSPVSPENFKTWLHGTFVSGSQQKAELELLKMTIMSELQKEEETVLGHEYKSTPGNIQGEVSIAQLERAIQSAIFKYDADKVGLADFALESGGGSILSTRCSENYKERNAVLTFFNIPIMTLTKTARTVIQPGVYPGECWAFRGYEGYVVIQLSAVINVESFTLEHIPRNIAPNKKIESAPKDFSVIGLRNPNDLDGHMFGRYKYDEWGAAYQNFVVQNTTEETFNIIELRIHSNYGHLEYTCVYRFRVHGRVV